VCHNSGCPLTTTPCWLMDVPADELVDVVRSRIRREVTDFADVVDMWDAINEAVIMPVFTAEVNAITPLAQRLGRVETVRLAFDTAREAGATTLVLNDFNMSPAYEQLIAECLDAGVRIDAIGLQSHMHQGWWGREKTNDVLERFSRFGLPLHFSETTLVSGALMPPEIEDLNDYQPEHWPSTPEGEERQAQEMVQHYRTLVEHPAVQVITYWGLSDDGAWLGAPSGLVRADGTPKPSYDALRGLIKGEWWLAPTTVVSDGQGRVAVNGFTGTYQLTVGGLSATVELDHSGAPDLAARLT
jgi:endo-1,4-beta-xylanase